MAAARFTERLSLAQRVPLQLYIKSRPKKTLSTVGCGIERGQAVGGFEQLVDATAADFFAQQLLDGLRREQSGGLRPRGPGYRAV